MMRTANAFPAKQKSELCRLRSYEATPIKPSHSLIAITESGGTSVGSSPSLLKTNQAKTSWQPSWTILSVRRSLGWKQTNITAFGSSTFTREMWSCTSLYLASSFMTGPHSTRHRRDLKATSMHCETTGTPPRAGPDPTIPNGGKLFGTSLKAMSARKSETRSEPT